MAQESESNSDSDPEAWLNAIAGRATIGYSATEAKEAERLRLVMRELDEEIIVGSNLDHDWQQLRFRLRQEGLTGNKTRSVGMYWALAATVVLTTCIGLLWSLNQQDAPESTVMRGKSVFVKVIRTEMPEALTKKILDACIESHISCSENHDASGASIVNVRLAETAPPAFMDALQVLGINDLPTEKELTLVVMRKN